MWFRVDGDAYVVVFGYRAFHIARGDTEPLPGMEPDDYARTAGADPRPAADLLAPLEIAELQPVPKRRPP